MEKVKQWFRKWLGIPSLEAECGYLRDKDQTIERTLLMHAETVDKRHEEFIELVHTVQELSGRVGDLESAYPDYKKAKAEADQKKATEVIPGFRPFSRRKRDWEREHRKSPEKK